MSVAETMSFTKASWQQYYESVYSSDVSEWIGKFVAALGDKCQVCCQPQKSWLQPALILGLYAECVKVSHKNPVLEVL